jgi:UDP-N-acetylglucosamine 2-epimerase
LFVEGPAAVQIHVDRGTDPDLVHDTGNPRYDAMNDINTAEIRAQTRRRLGLSDERVMLWAGQPDYDNSFLALKRLIDGYSGGPVTLLFRAHPRDEFYVEGRYTELLASTAMHVIDVSAEPDAISLYSASDLVATQFSSAALEASHLGVPALLVLFDDLGKKYLRTNKGYELPPWCHDNCSFMIEDGNRIPEVLVRALCNDTARAEIISNFRARFSKYGGIANSIAEHIQATVSQQV